MTRIRGAERGCGSNRPHGGVCDGRSKQHHGGIEAVSAAEAPELASAARVVVCEITRGERTWKGFTRALAEAFSGNPRKTRRRGVRIYDLRFTRRLVFRRVNRKS